MNIQNIYQVFQQNLGLAQINIYYGIRRKLMKFLQRL